MGDEDCAIGVEEISRVPMNLEELESILGKKITQVGYEEFGDSSVLILMVRGKEFYIRSDSPMELDIESEQ